MRRGKSTILVAAAVAGALAGCGGGGETTSTTAATAPQGKEGATQIRALLDAFYGPEAPPR